MEVDSVQGTYHAASTKAGTELVPSAYRGDSIDIYVNSTCNLKCKTCFLGDSYFSSVNNMSLERAEAILRWAKLADVHDVAFLGGEPSLHPHIDQLLDLARSVRVDTIRIITNGSRPFQRLLSSAVCKNIDIAQISLDGPTEATNDAIRGRGAFRQATRTMEMLRAKGIPFVITASVTPISYAVIDTLIEFAETSGSQVLNIHWVSPTGRARNGACSIRPAAWVELCNRINNYKISRTGFTVQCQAAYKLIGHDEQNPAIREDRCAVRDTTNLQFMPDNSVYACGMVVDTPQLNGYKWTGKSLLVRAGTTELSICHTARHSGCPLRTSEQPDASTDAAQFTPVCIYERFYNEKN